jgi:hypothetical protein
MRERERERERAHGEIEGKKRVKMVPFTHNFTYSNNKQKLVLSLRVLLLVCST